MRLPTNSAGATGKIVQADAAHDDTTRIVVESLD